MQRGRRSERHPGGSIGSSSRMALSRFHTCAAARSTQNRGVTRDVTRLLTAVLFILLIACTGDKAKELLETAEFEERQMNIPHAKQLYEEVIRLYPSSQEAEKARGRLIKLSQS
jgi:hypothetical protein